MSNDTPGIGPAIARILALTGGAIAGALIANWFDKTFSERAQQKSEYDRSRYAQGLAPIAPEASPLERQKSEQPRIIRVEEYVAEDKAPERDI